MGLEGKTLVFGQLVEELYCGFPYLGLFNLLGDDRIPKPKPHFHLYMMVRIYDVTLWIMILGSLDIMDPNFIN